MPSVNGKGWQKYDDDDLMLKDDLGSLDNLLFNLL
jgi:hypothetical protein